MKEDTLKDYKEKRDFTQTSEPVGKANKKFKKPIFVIQKHDAQNLHYDVRIEIDNVLKSWAVPKGPSTDPSVKRLAIPTEDHPYDYGDFEGVIPEGNYGAGEIIIWDKGTYENNSKEDEEDVSINKAYDNGHIKVWLKGEKLKGGYAFIRTSKGEDEKWLLIKEDDSEADARRNPVSTEPKSVISNDTINDLKDRNE